MGADTNQAVLGRFAAACQGDGRVVAAFLGGSYAAETADEYSDLDLYLILADEAYDTFFAERAAFMQRLGDPVFLEDFDGFGFAMVVFIFADGVAGELSLARESRFEHIHGGPVTVLVDKQGLLTGRLFPLHQPTELEQRATLHRLVHWFWRDLSKYCTALARGQLWTAYGLLETLRLTCVNLARLKHDFTASPEGYAKVEQAVDTQDRAALQATFCAVDRDEMLKAAHSLVQYYVQTAPSLASMHGMTYPIDLERVVLRQLDELGAAHVHAATAGRADKAGEDSWERLKTDA